MENPQNPIFEVSLRMWFKIVFSMLHKENLILSKVTQKLLKLKILVSNNFEHSFQLEVSSAMSLNLI